MQKWNYSFFIFLIFPLFSLSQWTKSPSSEYKGKQDDIFFVDENIGWYVNGDGNIFKTMNGGKQWDLQFSKKGTFFRCIGFIDSLNGFAGNIGTEYFPNVTDTIPLYKTTNGGKTWEPINFNNCKGIKGLCSIDILKKPFINAGKLEYKNYIFCGGRVGGPGFILKSFNNGDTWTCINVNQDAKMILDLKFFSKDTGFVFSASSNDIEFSHGLILKTNDGGLTWKKVYESKRPFELTWKASFVDRKIAYTTLQSYNPDSLIGERYILKTMDGGESWSEIPLLNDSKNNEFGIGFIDESHGFVGTTKSGYETKDGGKTWSPIGIGKAVNKFRIIKSNKKIKVYSIGKEIYYNEFNTN